MQYDIYEQAVKRVLAKRRLDDPESVDLAIECVEEFLDEIDPNSIDDSVLALLVKEDVIDR